ncbi:MAG: hypothetical protein AB1750_15120, partial [Chloroflexota bacterium]
MSDQHLSRRARDRFALERLRFEDIASARAVAAQMNVSAGDLYALGLIDEALRILLTRRASPSQFSGAASFLDDKVGAAPVRDTQVRFVSEFPTKPVYDGRVTPDDYLSESAHTPTPTPQEHGRGGNTLE